MGSASLSPAWVPAPPEGAAVTGAAVTASAVTAARFELPARPSPAALPVRRRSFRGAEAGGARGGRGPAASPLGLPLRAAPSRRASFPPGPAAGSGTTPAAAEANLRAAGRR